MTSKDKTLIIVVEAIDRNTAVLEKLADAIGREVAKWLIKADVAKTSRMLQEEVYSEMGFQPVEIVDMLYPSLGKKDRRAKSQQISLRRKR